LAGGSNVFGDQDAPYPLVSLEEIVGRRPDLIIESLYGAEVTDELRAAARAQWRAVGHIPAAASGRVHILDADYATIPSPRVVLMAADLVRLIHPEVSLDQD
jgi:iron complex transport system substrate-binding protein